LPRQITAKSEELATAQQASAQARQALEWAAQVRKQRTSIELDEGETAYAVVPAVQLMEKRWRDGEKPWTSIAEGSVCFTDRRMIFDGEQDLDFAYDDWTDSKPWSTGFHVAVGTRLTLSGPIDQLEVTFAAVQSVMAGVDPKKPLKEADKETAAVVASLQDDLKRLNWTLGALRRPTPPRSPAWALGAVLAVTAGGASSAAILTGDATPARPTTTTTTVQVVAAAPSTTTTEVPPSEVSTAVQGAVYQLATVVSVADGETVQVLLDDGSQDLVKLIGIEAPDLAAPYSTEARAFLEEMVIGREVWLVTDTSDRDAFGRLLRYVYLGTDLVNLRMVESGLAFPVEDPPDTHFSAEFRRAGEVAQGATIGVWASTTTTTAVVAAPTSTTSTTAAGTDSSTTSTTAAPTGCHASYTGGCVPAGVTDVDCAGGGGDGPFFVSGPIHVVGYDVYVLDVDGDGVACNT
jgi:endonuclease YncB( thermonuclease family)